MLSTFPSYSLEESAEFKALLHPTKRIRTLRFAKVYRGLDHRAANAYLLANSPADERIALFGLPEDVEYTQQMLTHPRVSALKMYFSYVEPSATTIYEFFKPEILEVAQSLGKPIVLHLPKMLVHSIGDLLGVLRDFPRLRVGIAHLGLSKFVVPGFEDAYKKKVIPSLFVPGSVQRLEDFARNEQGELDAAIAKELAQPLPLDFRRSDYSDVIAFFEEASYDYDSDLRNPYWAFSHEILKFILTHHIRSHFGSSTSLRIFDAGAGTGNWSNFVLGLSTQAQGILFDMNSAMLSQVFPKVRSLSGNVVRIREGNLEVRADYTRDASNLILCMHNVIGMGRNSARILVTSQTISNQAVLHSSWR